MEEGWTSPATMPEVKGSAALKRHIKAHSETNKPTKGNGKKPRKIICPILECQPPKKALVSGDKCFKHDRQAKVQKIEGWRCFDKFSATIKMDSLYCPLNAYNGEYMWMNENL